MFDPQTYASRREALLKGLASRGLVRGRILLLGNRESPMNYVDNCYAFRQDSSFLYFIGIPLPALAATIDLATGRATLYGDDATMDDIVWTGPQPAVAELASRSSIDATRPRSALARDLPSRDLAPASSPATSLQAREGPRETCSTSRPTAPTRAPNSRS